MSRHRIGLALLLTLVHQAQAQEVTRDVATVYLKEGGTIRGSIVADNGPKGIRVRSLSTGSTFQVTPAQVDSIVRDPAPKPAGAIPAPASAAAPVPRMPSTRPAGSIPTPTPVATAEVEPWHPPARVSAEPLLPVAIAPAPVRVVEAPEPPPATAVPAPLPVQRLPVTWPAGTVPTAPPAMVVTTTAPVPVADALDPPPATALALAPALRDTTPKAPPDSVVRTTVAFISGSEYYVGAGRADGLVEGALLPVFHGDSVVATLRVKFLASHRASCEATEGESSIAAGDSVRWQRPSVAQFAAAQVVPMNRPHRMSGPGLHGRLGMRYLRAGTTTMADGQQVGSNGFNQPSLDARINGLALWGTPLGVAIDVRTRQTTTTSLGTSSVDGHTRVYQAVLFWNAGVSGFHAAAGRQYLATVSSVGLFDGALAEVNGSHVSGGAFAGFEPDAANLGFSSAVRDFGGYFTMHNRPGTSTAVAFTIGAVGSYEATAARREWGIAQLSISNRYLSLYLLQELDYYRPWKLEGPNAESSAFSGTSQFANASVRATNWLAINATYDKRRSVPVIRDFTNPETIFDDSYREGYGAGVQLTGKQVFGGGDWRKSTGLTSGSAQSYTATLGVNRVTRLNVGLSGRATWYQNDNVSTPGNPLALKTSGQLYSGRLSIDPMIRLQLSLNAGLRQEHNPISPDLQRSSWFGLDADVNIARAWFASFSALMQKDPANPGTSTLTQVYGGLTWRF